MKCVRNSLFEWFPARHPPNKAMKPTPPVCHDAARLIAGR